MQTKEGLFQIKGRLVAALTEKTFSSCGKIKLITLHLSILNKEEIIQLVNWLISKSDEM